MEERKLDNIIIHPTLIPRLHAEAFRKGEIRVGRLREDGFQVYEKTDKADVNVDYFPTGNIFLPPETRKVLIELAVAEAGLGNGRSDVLSRNLRHPRLPGRDRRDQAPHPGERLHTLHGTDFGGMMVRQICDECGWIYPWCILRRDKVSATAIRRAPRA